jgi:hypothetical protein
MSSATTGTWSWSRAATESTASDILARPNSCSCESPGCVSQSLRGTATRAWAASGRWRAQLALAIEGRKVLVEHAHRAGDDAVVEWRKLAGSHLRAGSCVGWCSAARRRWLRTTSRAFSSSLARLRPRFTAFSTSRTLRMSCAAAERCERRWARTVVAVPGRAGRARTGGAPDGETCSCGARRTSR